MRMLCFKLLIVAAAIAVAFAADCEFYEDFYNGYTCELSNAVVAQESDDFTITGTHLAGKSNADVVALVDGSDNQLTFIPPMLTELFPNLEIINFYGVGLENLTPNSFTNCASLRNLYIYGNNIRTVPAGALNRCTRLRYLNLNHNQIQNIEAGAFTSLTRITILDLSSNAITTIQQNLFQSQVNLEELYLLDNQISTIEIGAFRSLANILIMDIGTNSLSELDADVFELAPLIDYLYLDSNLFTAVPKLNLPNLNQLWMIDNQIASFTGNEFDGMLGLQVINLKGNQIKILDGTPFVKLSALTQLSLENNIIEALDPDIISQLPQLKTLTIANNICADTNLYNLASLTAESVPELDRCFYHYIEPQQFPECTFQYTVQYGYHCLIYNLVFESFRDKFKFTGTHLEGYSNDEIKSVIILNATMTRIPPCTFEDFHQIYTLKIEGIHVLNQDTLEVCPPLVLLDLSNNRITKIDKYAFDSCPGWWLGQLHLNNNQIAGIEPNSHLLLKSKLLEMQIENNICIDEIFEDFPGIADTWYFMYRCHAFWYLMNEDA